MRLKQSNLLCALACVATAPTFAAAQTTEPAQTIKVANPSAADNTQTIQEVVVTAERRTNSIQRTPAAVSVRTGTELLTEGKFTTKQILEDVPGVIAVDNSSLNVGSADVQGNNITIRGVTPGTSASGGPSGISAVPPTAIYVDGVYEGVGSNYDLDRVEVLRGPQGTLYGRSATAGVVSFHTRNPVLNRYTGDLNAEFGSYQLQHYDGGVNVPIGDKLAARISGDYYDQNQGFYGQAKSGERQRENGRVKLLWEPTSDVSALVGFAYETDNSFSGGKSSTASTTHSQTAPPPGPPLATPVPPDDANVLSGAYATGAAPLTITTTSTAVFPSQKVQREYWAEINWNIGFATLTYLPAYRTWQQHDNSLQTANFIASGVPLVQSILTPLDQFQTHEFRVTSNAESSLHWLAGAFYYENKLQNTNFNALTPLSGAQVPLSSTSDQKHTQNTGYFAEATYSPISTLRLTAGVRYDDTSVTASESYFNNAWAFCGTALQFSLGPAAASCTGTGTSSLPQPAVSSYSISNVTVKFHNFNYKVRAEYDLTPINMMYGTVSTGFRPGDVGINNGAPNIYNSEKLTAFEFGSKNRFLNNSLQVNVATYYYMYDGFQTSYIPDTPSGTDYASIMGAVRVTVPARMFGAELEMVYRPTAHDQIGVNYAYGQSQWVNKPAAFAAAQPETYRAMTPHTVTANYRHNFDLPGGSTITAAIDGIYDAGHLGANPQHDLVTAPPASCYTFPIGLTCTVDWRNYAMVPTETVGNAQITWSSPDRTYSVTGYVRNFTDARYTTYTVGPQPFNVNFTDPRVFGVTLSGRF